jgi:Arc/MetJ-type ribon-helix-helix transcriptional regulator
VQVAFRLSDRLLTGIDYLVETGRFSSRTEVVRAAVEQLLDEAHRSDIDAAIVAGYQRTPDESAEGWVSSATRALVAEEPWDSSGRTSVVPPSLIPATLRPSTSVRKAQGSKPATAKVVTKDSLVVSPGPLRKVKSDPAHRVHFGVSKAGVGYLVIPNSFTYVARGFTNVQEVRSFIRSHDLVLYSVGKVEGTVFESLSPTGKPLQDVPGYRVPR